MPPARILYPVAFVLACSPWASSADALLLGLVMSLWLRFPPPPIARKAAKWLLQGSIVALGFAMTPSAVWRAGASGIGITALSIILTLGAGWALARWIGVRSRLAALITVGTAICGGSAIAAMGPVLGADSDEMAVSLSVVFLLNAVALVIFPPLGHLLGLPGPEFGLFAAIAIHDTSSVVGAATAYSDLAIPVAVTVKLTRALWILPMAFGAALYLRRRAVGSTRSAPFPWFVLLFVAAVALKALVPSLDRVYEVLGDLGKAGLKGAIFLISAQMTLAAIRRVGPKPLTFAVALWALVIVATFALVHSGLLIPPS